LDRQPNFRAEPFKENVWTTMGAELLAGLRGCFGDMTDYFGNPWFLFVAIPAILVIYLIYRRTS
jgi:hypothetical protein